MNDVSAQNGWFRSACAAWEGNDPERPTTGPSGTGLVGVTVAVFGAQER